MEYLWNIYGHGWWLRKNTSEKYEFVNWDDDIPNTWKIKYMFQSTNQMVWDSDGIIVEYEKKKLIINLDH